MLNGLFQLVALVMLLTVFRRWRTQEHAAVIERTNIARMTERALLESAAQKAILQQFPAAARQRHLWLVSEEREA